MLIRLWQALSLLDRAMCVALVIALIATGVVARFLDPSGVLSSLITGAATFVGSTYLLARLLPAANSPAGEVLLGALVSLGWSCLSTPVGLLLYGGVLAQLEEQLLVPPWIAATATIFGTTVLCFVGVRLAHRKPDPQS